MARSASYRPDVVTTYNAFGGYGHPDHIRVHDVAIRAVPRAGDAGLVPGAARGGGLEPWAPAKFYEQATPESVRTAMNERLSELGVDSFWLPPKDATPEQLAEYEERMAKMLVPDETITTWVDIADVLELKWEAIQRHVTQITMDFPFMASASRAGASSGRSEAFILRESRVETGSRRPICSPGSAEDSGAVAITRAASLDAGRPGPSRPGRRPPGRGSSAGPCPG